MISRVSPDDTTLLHIPILKEEDARYAANTGIASANFYKGDIKEAYSALKSRLKDVIIANPWIAGVVKPLSKAPNPIKKQILNDPALKNKIGQSLLVFPKTFAENSELEDTVNEILVLEDKIDPDLHRSTTYRQLATACQTNSRVIPNRSGLYKSGQKVTKITIVPVSTNEFCVILAMSHLIADGDTYFKIMAMLSTKKSVEFTIDKLDPNRQFGYRKIEQHLIGIDEWKFLSGIKTVKMMIQGVLTKAKKDKEPSAKKDSRGFEEPSGLRIRASYIDKTKVVYQDCLNGTATDTSTNLFKKKTGGVNFISTQDIITSSWFNATSSRLPMFTFNLRERSQDLPKNLAGNYETSMVLDPTSYSNASLVRKALLPTSDGRFKRANPMRLPGFCGKTSCGFITTWCFLLEDKTAGLYLQDCEQLLHMPIMPVSVLKMCPMDFGVVFNACNDDPSNGNSPNNGNKQAILMFCKEATDDVLTGSADSVLGNVVNSEMFYNPS